MYHQLDTSSTLVFRGTGNLSLFSYLMESRTPYKVAGQGYNVDGTKVVIDKYEKVHLFVYLNLKP